MTLEEFHSYQEQTFDSFCKSVIRNESIDAFRELAYRREHEVEFSALSASELAALHSKADFNTYRKNYRVLGYVIEVCDPALGENLQFMPAQFCDIILLSYFLDYTDFEIGNLLHVNKSTVRYRRVAALRRLKKMLEDFERE